MTNHKMCRRRRRGDDALTNHKICRRRRRRGEGRRKETRTGKATAQEGGALPGSDQPSAPFC